MDDVLLRLAVVLAVVAGAALVGSWWRRRAGRVRTVAAGVDHHAPAFGDGALARVGLDLAQADGGAVLLSSPTCGSCAHVERILTEVTERRPGFRWVTVDATEHLDLARDHHVMRVPTLFVLDVGGRILARTSGVPARAELERAIDREGARG